MDRDREIFQLKQDEVKDRLDSQLNNGSKTFLVVSKNSAENKGFVKNYLFERYSNNCTKLDFTEMSAFDILDENSTIENLIKSKYESCEEVIETPADNKVAAENEVQKPKEKSSSSKKVKRKPRIGFFDILILLIGLSCIAAAYLGYLEDILNENTSFGENQILAINIALYALGGLWVFVFLVSLFDNKEKVEKKSEKSNKEDLNGAEESVVSATKETVVTKKSLGKNKKNTIIITGLNSYIESYSEEKRERVTDRIRFEFAHIYSWLKNNSECELVLVWNEKVFISADLTLLVFDTTIEIDPDFEKIERGCYFSESLLDEGILVNSSHANKFASELKTYEEIDFLVRECAKVVRTISENVDGIKLVFVLYIKYFEKEKYDLLSDHFLKKDTPVRISKITISKKDFDLFSGNKVKSFDFDDLDLGQEMDDNFASLKFPKLVEDKDFEFINAKIEDDYGLLVKYINTLSDDKLYKYCNLDIINYLIHERETILVKRLIHSMVNVEFSDCADYVKYFYNGLVKNEKERGYQNSARALRYFYETIIDIEDGRDATYATGNAEFYKENRNLIFKMIEYVHQNARKLDYVKFNDEHASEIILRKD